MAGLKLGADAGNTGCDGPLLPSEAEAVDPVGAVVCRRHLSHRLLSLLLLLLFIVVYWMFNRFMFVCKIWIFAKILSKFLEELWNLLWACKGGK